MYALRASHGAARAAASLRTPLRASQSLLVRAAASTSTSTMQAEAEGIPAAYKVAAGVTLAASAALVRTLEGACREKKECERKRQ